MDQTLLLFDYDGTALGGHTPYRQFPPRFASFLDSLDEQGILWGTNSSWGVWRQLEVIEQSSVRSRPFVLIGDSGREIAHLNRGMLRMDEEYYDSVLEKDQEFRERNLSMVREALPRIAGLPLIDRFMLDIYRKNVIYFRCPESAVPSALDAVRRLVESGEYSHQDEEATGGWISLRPKYMNKGTPIQYLQSKYAINPARTIVAGDENNDIPMMHPTVARHMVCPANARKDIKDMVRAAGGVVSKKQFSVGVEDGVRQILVRGVAGAI